MPVGLVCSIIILLAMTLRASKYPTGEPEELEGSAEGRGRSYGPSSDSDCDLVGSTKSVFRNYANFTGEATCAEFFHWSAIYFAVSAATALQWIVIVAILNVNHNSSDGVNFAGLWLVVGFVAWVGFWVIPTSIPTLALVVRSLRKAGLPL